MTTATARAATIRLSPRLNGALNTQAKAMNISKAALVRRALMEKLEDMQDLTDAKESKAKGGKSISMAKLKAELALENRV